MNKPATTQKSHNNEEGNGPNALQISKFNGIFTELLEHCLVKTVHAQVLTNDTPPAVISSPIKVARSSEESYACMSAALTFMSRP